MFPQMHALTPLVLGPSYSLSVSKSYVPGTDEKLVQFYFGNCAFLTDSVMIPNYFRDAYPQGSKQGRRSLAAYRSSIGTQIVTAHAQTFGKGGGKLKIVLAGFWPHLDQIEVEPSNVYMSSQSSVTFWPDAGHG